MSDIAAWLDRLGLGKYAPVFADNDVDLDVLRRLSEDDLRELGLPLGARRKILQALAETRETGSTTLTSQAATRDAVSPTGPERRQITVMFSDVVGSTSLAEQVDVEDLCSLVLAYQQACAEAIERHGGYVAQYLGDGVLAYFGYPTAHEDDAVRAVRASLTIIERMPEISTRLRSEHGVGFEIRIGLHTGLVVAGEMGAGGTVVAHHLQGAGDDRLAWSGWRDAGELAARRSASHEAVEHFTHAADCLKRMGAGAVAAEEEAAIHLGLLDALMQAEGYRSDKLAQAMHAAQRAARASSSTSLQWKVAVLIAPVFYGTGRNWEYLAAVGTLDQGSSSDDDPGLRAGLLATRGIAHFNRGEFIDAARDLQGAIDLLIDLHGEDRPRLGGGDPAVVVHSYLVWALYRLGRPDEGFKIAVAGERIGRALDDAFSLAWALEGRGRAYFFVDDYESARADAEETIAICRRHAFRARLGSGLHLRGISRAYLGELEQGIDDGRESLAIWRGVLLGTPWMAKDLADLLLMAGRVAEAGAVLDDVDVLVSETDEASSLPECQRARGMIALASGDAPGAERWLETAITTARRQGARMFELRATTGLAELLESQGRHPEASRRLGDIYALFTEGHRTPDLRAAKALLDRLQT